MNITSAQYNKDNEGNNVTIACTINNKNYIVPIDPDNTDYQAIFEWSKKDGNTIEEAE